MNRVMCLQNDYNINNYEHYDKFNENLNWEINSVINNNTKLIPVFMIKKYAL